MTASSPSAVFDGALVRQRLLRARQRGTTNGEGLFDDVASQLMERLDEITHPFHAALDLSPFPFLERRSSNALAVRTPPTLPDEEPFPSEEEKVDLIVSNLGLHWVNDLPGLLLRLRAMLKKDGLFLASLIGGDSLTELRSCLLDAEIAETKGASPRFSPRVDLRTAGNLMQKAGFRLPVADIETVTLLYPDMVALMHDLRATGQTNARFDRIRHLTRRSIFIKAAQLYQERFSNADGLIPASFDILYLHGWT
ncbi:MAG: methyltransferase domain-containing protein [Alphaproteobacteria bacterium]|nr:methyltransferase domain-containing protein [Alphaproteobacteria bacterium]